MQSKSNLYEIPDNVKNNIFTLLGALANKGISLQEVEAIHEIGVVLSRPVKGAEPSKK